MANKITLGVLAEKIDNLHAKVDDVCKFRIEPVEANCRVNTEFRNKATGIIAVITTIGVFVGGIAMWIINKIWK